MMSLLPDYQRMDSSTLTEALIQAAGERAILMVSDAPKEELNSAQTTLDTIQGELMRRFAW